MKKIVILTLLVVATFGQVLAQATREQIAMADREISRASVELKKAERDFSAKKNRDKLALQRDYKKWEIKGNRSESVTEIDSALKETKRIQSQIDALDALKGNEEIAVKQAELKKWQDKKAELQAQFLTLKPKDQAIIAKADSITSDSVKLIKPANSKKSAKKVKKSSDAQPENIARPPKDLKAPVAKAPKEDPDIYNRKIPTEVSRVSYNRRDRSYGLRREELVLTKIEQNINSAISPGASEGGYKVIFDNMYLEPVNFQLKSVNSSASVSVMLDKGIRQTKYLLPGRYLVTLYVNGRPSGQPRTLSIDGQTCDYKGETCFGFVYAPRF